MGPEVSDLSAPTISVEGESSVTSFFNKSSYWQTSWFVRRDCGFCLVNHITFPLSITESRFNAVRRTRRRSLQGWDCLSVADIISSAEPSACQTLLFNTLTIKAL